MIVFLERGFKCYIAEAENGSLWAFVAVKAGHPWHGSMPYETAMAGLMWGSSAADHIALPSPDRPSAPIGSGDDWIFGIEVSPSNVEGEPETVAREAIDCITAMLKRAK
jgi:hypothetical protein